MTAIALLNALADPHIVADTLLTSEGPANPGARKIWLPATGHVDRTYDSPDGVGHMVRLARKTIVLPNQSGLLAFSGLCTPGRAFWNSYSERWDTLQGYEATAKIDIAFLENVLRDMGKQNRDAVSLLGVLVDHAGNRTPFVHSHITPLETAHFGVCYVSGSGSDLIAEIVKRADAHLSRSGGWPPSCHFSATEDLAEHIAAEMLFRENDSCNGSEGTPLANHCGGFYEWYAISANGVVVQPRRLDLHVSVVGSELIFNNAYLLEHMHLAADASRPARYVAHHMTLIFEPHRIRLPTAHHPVVALSFKSAYGTVAEQAFYRYDDPSESLDAKSGPCDQEYLSCHFATPVSVDRVRVITTNSDGSARMARIVRHGGTPEPAVLVHEDSALHLLLGPEVVFRIGPMQGRTNLTSER